jgi:hypothetical protein
MDSSNLEELMTQRTMRTLQAVILVSLFLPAAALAGDIGFRGWGPRVGISSNPDQIVGGAQFDFGEFASHVRLQPSAEIGFGDHVTTFQANVMVAYYFPVKSNVTPYAGGSLSAAFYNFDSTCRGFGNAAFGRNRCNDNTTEIGPVAVGGIETKLSNKARFLAELQLGFGDLPDAKLVAGWLF